MNKLILLGSVAFAVPAYAAGTAAALVPVFNDVLAVIAAVAVPVLMSLVQRYVKDTSSRAALQTAITNAVGVAANYGQQQGDQFLSNVPIRNTALQLAIGYVSDQAPKAMAYFGQTPTDIAAKIEAALALHLNLASPIPAPAKSVPAVPAGVILPVTPPVSVSTTMPAPPPRIVAQTDNPASGSSTPAA